MSVGKKIVNRGKIIFVLVVLFAVIVFGQIINLQFINGEKWRKKAVQNIIKEQTIEAGRGNILASDNSILAISTPSFVLTWDTRFPKGKDSLRFHNGLDSLADSLSHFFKDYTKSLYKEQLLKARYSKRAYYVIHKNLLSFVDRERMMRWPFIRYKTAQNGIRFEKKEVRVYPYDSLGRKTIGTISRDSVGGVIATGIEYSFGKELSGTEGKRMIRKIGTEYEPITEAGEIEAVDGYDVVTTLDVQVQDIAYKALQKAVKTSKAKYGVALVMEVKTGKLRAVANYPEIFQYAIAQPIEPGSTFKLASVLAALEDKYVTPSDKFETGNGSWKFYDQTMLDTKPHGMISVQEGFEVSSNILHGQLIKKYYGKQPNAFFNRLEQFGLTKTSNVGLVGEPKPYFLRPEDKRLWNETTLPWLSTGYTATLTPLQILTFYNAIANNGYSVKPMLVEEIRKASKTIRKYPVETSQQPICSKESLEMVRRMLEGVVKRGTAKNIYTPHYEIAGKTGTSQKVKNGTYQQIYEASFCGYFPARNPLYSIYVLLDEPQLGSYGAEVAAPVFLEISNQLFSINQAAQDYRNIKDNISNMLPTVKKSYLTDIKQIYDELSIAHSGGDSGLWASATPIPGKKAAKVITDKISIYNKVMPNLKDMTLKDALYLLENMKLKVIYKGHGKVVTQSVGIGTPVYSGMTVILDLQ